MRRYYSGQELDEIGEAVVKDYYGERRRDIPASVDIDGLVTGYLKLPIIYRTFAEEKGKLGFLSDGWNSLRVMEGKRVRDALFPQGTIVIEEKLLQPFESGRRRFTIAHEAAHYICERSMDAAILKCLFNSEEEYTREYLRDLFGLEEGQIDRLAAALLMPGYILRYNLRMIFYKNCIPVYGEHVLDLEDKLLIKRMAKVMDVSDTAMMIRLKDEGLFERRSISEHVGRMKLRAEGDGFGENI